MRLLRLLRWTKQAQDRPSEANAVVYGDTTMLARAVVEQRANPATLLSLLSAARSGPERDNLANVSSAVAFGARALAEALAFQLVGAEGEDPSVALRRVREVIADVLTMPRSPQHYCGLVPPGQQDHTA